MNHKKRYTNSFSMRSREKKKAKRKKMLLTGTVVLAVALVLVIGIGFATKTKKAKEEPEEAQVEATREVEETKAPEPTKEPWSFVANENADTEKFSSAVVSKKGILIDVDNGTVLAQKGGRKQMYPASMTKVLTVLVAAENVSEAQLDERVPITTDITDYCYRNDCSAVGFSKNEKPTVRDLFYGTILPSGADAAMALANYVAGSQEAFVKLMNEKLEELGISGTTHFTNCIGLYDDNHYSTPYDMAVIMKAASENALCSQVMNARTYTTGKTKKHKDGILVSNWFLRRIEDKDTGGEVLYAKTGFVNQSGNCAVSMAKDKEGHTYICVTAGSTSSWRCIYDHVELYHRYLKK